MNQKQIKATLEHIFETVERNDGSEVRAFTPASMHEDSGEYPIQQAISKAMQDSGLTFDFSYEVADKAVDILAESEDWTDQDAINEAIDLAIPVFTFDLMEMYASDSWQVDEAVKEMGGDNEDSVKRAQIGWYVAIQNMTNAIISNLSELQS